ncbi:hypothetical protein [Rhodococcus jostii]|uniref:hypothetical protein n=2 Tax=Rhodococcus TaxID=1827 RepID=UPI0011D0B1E1|nr:hypothetical protein [Rhodococcus jostii]
MPAGSVIVAVPSMIVSRDDVAVFEVGGDTVHAVYLERHYGAAGAVRVQCQLQGRLTGELPFGEIGQVTVGRSAEKRRVPGNGGLNIDDGDYCVYAAGLHGRSSSPAGPECIDSPLDSGQRLEGATESPAPDE